MTTVPDADHTPREVPWSTIEDFDLLSERVSAVVCLFGSVIGMNNGSVEWCPDDDPPTESERLAWLWLCHPSFDTQLELARADLRKLMHHYRAGDMLEWWRYMGTGE